MDGRQNYQNVLNSCIPCLIVVILVFIHTYYASQGVHSNHRVRIRYKIPCLDNGELNERNLFN